MTDKVYCVIEEYMRGEPMPVDPDMYDGSYADKGKALQHAAGCQHGIIVTLKKTTEGWILI